MPALGVSLLLIAAGAILAFAVSTAVEGVAIVTVGVILMIVGGIGLLFLMSFSPWGTHDTAHSDHMH
jgi:multisubunit Na+/H+ antiporter MnhB subunit